MNITEFLMNYEIKYHSAYPEKNLHFIIIRPITDENTPLEEYSFQIVKIGNVKDPQ